MRFVDLFVLISIHNKCIKINYSLHGISNKSPGAKTVFFHEIAQIRAYMQK